VKILHGSSPFFKSGALHDHNVYSCAGRYSPVREEDEKDTGVFLIFMLFCTAVELQTWV
jgi:hypothetical protein